MWDSELQNWVRSPWHISFVCDSLITAGWSSLVTWDIATATIQMQNFEQKTRLQGAILWRKYLSLLTLVTLTRHRKLGGMSQAIVSFGKCLSELHVGGLSSHSVIFAKGTSGDVMGMQQIVSKAGVESPDVLQPYAAVCSPSTVLTQRMAAYF